MLPALVAVGGACGLTALPAGALELGDAQINSALGQPLRASIAYALNPTEQLHSYCIYLRPGGSANGIPAVSDARIAVTDRSIVLTGTTPVREPMISLQIAVDCAYTPHLVREYTLMVDPMVPVAASSDTVASTPAAAPAPREVIPLAQASDRRPARAAQSTAAPLARTIAPAAPIAMNSRYRVLPGDTVSTIVSRIEGRTIGLWPAVDLVHAANPDAFVNQDVNRLMAGSMLFIPDVRRDLVANEAPEPVTTAGEPVEMVGDLAPAEPAEISPAQPASNPSPAVVTLDSVSEQAAVPEAPAAAPVTTVQRPELRPGDVVMPPVGSREGSVVIPDTAIDIEPPASQSGGATSPPESGTTTGAWTWLMWLGGTGVALFFGLLLFGRTLRERFGSPGAGMMEVPARRQTDDPTQKNRVVRDVDFEFEDTINAQAISLDADLGAGTGLNSGEDMDVAQDFGFSTGDAAHGQLDLEITEQAARDPEPTPTDVIPPHHREDVSTILESEVPPDTSDDDAGEYDLSMIVDATKQPIDDYDTTAKDLQAVQVADVQGLNDSDEDEYTMSSAVDYHTLEQDYEDEFTATQALSAEMEKAAMDLAESVAAADADNITAEMPAQDAGNLEPTAEHAAAESRTHANRDSGDKPTVELPEVSDPDITAELTANVPTTIEAQNDSMANDGSEITIEMSAAGSDVTVEMQVESGRVDTKRKQRK